jgi:hypothetical protein
VNSVERTLERLLKESDFKRFVSGHDFTGAVRFPASDVRVMGMLTNGKALKETGSGRTLVSLGAVPNDQHHHYRVTADRLSV